MAIFVPGTHTSCGDMTFFTPVWNGGKSISKYLKEHHAGTDVFGEKFAVAQNWPPYQVEKFMTIQGRDLGTKVCVTRNNWDRMVSQFLFLQAHPNMKNNLDGLGYSYDLHCFKCFIMNGVWGKVWWPPQHEFYGLADVHLAYENIQNDWNSLKNNFLLGDDGNTLTVPDATDNDYEYRAAYYDGWWDLEMREYMWSRTTNGPGEDKLWWKIDCELLGYPDPYDDIWEECPEGNYGGGIFCGS